MSLFGYPTTNAIKKTTAASIWSITWPITGRAGTEPRSTGRNYTAGPVRCIGGLSARRYASLSAGTCNSGCSIATPGSQSGSNGNFPSRSGQNTWTALSPPMSPW